MTSAGGVGPLPPGRCRHQNQRQAGRQQHQRSFHSSLLQICVNTRSISLTSSTPLPGTWRRRGGVAAAAQLLQHHLHVHTSPMLRAERITRPWSGKRTKEVSMPDVERRSSAAWAAVMRPTVWSTFGYGNALMVHFGVLNNVVLGDGALQVVLEQLLDVAGVRTRAAEKRRRLKGAAACAANCLVSSTIRPQGLRFGLVVGRRAPAGTLAAR